MLEDRDYMRRSDADGPSWRPSYRPRWSWTVILLISYLIVFLAELLSYHFFPNSRLFHGMMRNTADGPDFFPGYLPLSLEGIEKGYLWQLVTYQFMHAGWIHLLMNSWVIYMFGRELESLLGGKKYLALILSSGVVGGVFQMLVALVWPQYFGGSVVGASAAGFGLIAAYAAMFPNRELQLLLFFFIPVSLRAKTFLIGSAVLAVAGFAFPDVIFPGVAHVAHLGGMAMGWFFIRHILQGDWSRLRGALRPAEKRNAPAARRSSPDAAANEFSEEQVNAVLDKISAQGIQSLSKAEREILEMARKRMGKR